MFCGLSSADCRGMLLLEAEVETQDNSSSTKVGLQDRAFFGGCVATWQVNNKLLNGRVYQNLKCRIQCVLSPDTYLSVSCVATYFGTVVEEDQSFKPTPRGRHRYENMVTASFFLASAYDGRWKSSPSLPGLGFYSGFHTFEPQQQVAKYCRTFSQKQVNVPLGGHRPKSHYENTPPFNWGLT